MFEVMKANIGGFTTHVITTPFFTNGSVLDHIAKYRGFDMLLWVRHFVSSLLAQHIDFARLNKSLMAWRFFIGMGLFIRTFIQ
jgi:hypothetical protein